MQRLKLVKRRKYNHYISLGYYCGIAQEMDRLGFRISSLPFDWLITENFAKVLKLIKNNFVGFMEYNNLAQEYSVNPKYYYDLACNIHFFHDFNEYQSLEAQYYKVRDKYNRRIHRLNKYVHESSLFMRYVGSEEELSYIILKEDEIKSLIKSFNSNNEIFYFIDSKYVKPDFKLHCGYFIVDNNKDKTVKRFLKQCFKLRLYLFLYSSQSGISIISNRFKYYIKKVARHLNRKQEEHKDVYVHVKHI